jgi:hypothetical protein
MVGTMIGTSPRDGAGVHPRAAVFDRRSRRPDLPRQGSLARGRLPGRDLFAGDDVWGAAERQGRMTIEKTWFGHPRGLTILFLTNMWEQFSYYGMRALLVYYMTKQLLLAQGTSSLIYGRTPACAYFTPLVGGFIADR